LFTILTNGHAYTQSRTKADFDNGWKFKLDSVNNYAEINVPIELKASESIVCDGTEYLQLYNERGKLKGTYKMSSLPPAVSSGAHTIIIDSSFGGEEPPKIEMQFKGLNKKEAVEIIK